ncbi:IS3 family transposase [Melittangium boletus]|nr:IS3 family transposase [Melittangium boletus]
MDVMAARVRELEREHKRQQRALSEARALLRLSTRARGLTLGGRGRRHPPDVRSQVRGLVEQAIIEGARQSSACRLLGLSSRTLQRWRHPAHARDGRSQTRRAPANRLDEHERRLALELLRSPSFQGLSPRQIVPRLADQDRYLASESTLYRLLRAQRRTPSARGGGAPSHSPPEQAAVAPNQIWSWDITYLRGPERGAFLYLYLVMDVFSRRIMGWRIHLEESARRAALLIRQVCHRQGVEPSGLILHADNGGPMKGSALVKTLRRLGIVPSYSRPRVSNDNTFVESLFGTLKGRPSYPREHFSSAATARAWVSRFVDWYNREHLHSRLGYVTPDDRYFGRDARVFQRRARLYEHARAQRPGRWSRHIRHWAPPTEPPRTRVRIPATTSLTLNGASSPASLSPGPE